MARIGGDGRCFGRGVIVCWLDTDRIHSCIAIDKSDIYRQDTYKTKCPFLTLTSGDFIYHPHKPLFTITSNKSFCSYWSDMDSFGRYVFGAAVFFIHGIQCISWIEQLVYCKMLVNVKGVSSPLCSVNLSVCYIQHRQLLVSPPYVTPSHPGISTENIVPPDPCAIGAAINFAFLCLIAAFATSKVNFPFLFFWQRTACFSFF